MKKKVKEDKKTEQEKVDKRREEVLARGRKFKYPLQYAKHKLVFNTIIIAVVAIVLLVVAGWFALYKGQSSWDVLYRITKVVPMSVAKVEDESVRFSDYLMLYKSSLMAVEKQAGQLGGDSDSAELKETYKRMALDDAEEYTYAVKLGKELEIQVSNEEIEEMFTEHRKVGGIERSEASFLKVISDNFGWTRDEYERMLYLSIMKMKVEKEIDQHANEVAGQVEAMIANGVGYGDIAGQLGEEVEYEETGTLVSNTNVDGGRTAAALELNDSEQSGKFVSNNGDGYYFVKLISKTATQVNYASIKVPFKEFNKRVEDIREAGKIKEHIKLQ